MNSTGNNSAVVAVCYGVMLLLALAVGLYPQWIYVPEEPAQPAPLPLLPMIVCGQLLFAFLVYPFLVWRQMRVDLSVASRVVSFLAQGALVAMLSVAFVWLGQFFSDATAPAVIRCQLVVASCWPLAIALGVALAMARWRLVAGAFCVLLSIGLPLHYYLLSELLQLDQIAWAWQVTPLLWAWHAATESGVHCLPQPLWPAGCWLAGAAYFCYIGLGATNRKPWLIGRNEMSGRP